MPHETHYIEIQMEEGDEWYSYGPFATQEEASREYDDFVEEIGVFPYDFRIEAVPEHVGYYPSVRHQFPTRYSELGRV